MIMKVSLSTLSLFTLTVLFGNHGNGMVTASLTTAGTPLAASYASFLEETQAMDLLNRIFLGVDDQAALHWSVDTKEETVTIAVAAAAIGWVALGLAQAGGMPGADIAVFEAAQPTQVQDYYATAYAAPIADDCATDWTLLDSYQDENMIAFVAKRALSTNDPQDNAIRPDASVSDSSSRIIMAWGDDDNLQYHGTNRARSAVRWFANAAPAVSSPPEQQEGGVTATTRLVGDGLLSEAQVLEQESQDAFILRPNNYQIPLDETTYYFYCVNLTDVMDMSTIDDDKGVHAIGSVIVPSPGETTVPPHVHHLTFYGLREPCNPLMTPDDQVTQSFGAVLGGWAPGASPLTYPPEAGLRLLGESGYQSVVVEMHYDNRDATPGLVDSTGIKFFYTRQLRTHDVGTMNVGDSFVGLRGQPLGDGPFQHTMTCPSSCTSATMTAPVTVFTEALHQHEIGTRIVNQVWRDDKLVHEAVLDYWDFRNAGIYEVPQEQYQLWPGDKFVTTCYTDGDADSTFGLGTRDEMCIAFLHYYPTSATVTNTFCSVGFPDPRCDIEYEKSAANADFDRFFGSPVDQCDDDEKDKDDKEDEDDKEEETKDSGALGLVLAWNLGIGMLSLFLVVPW